MRRFFKISLYLGSLFFVVLGFVIINSVLTNQQNLPKCPFIEDGRGCWSYTDTWPALIPFGFAALSFIVGKRVNKIIV